MKDIEAAKEGSQQSATTPTEKEEMKECEVIDVTSMMQWNPQTLSDENEHMEESEYAELKGVSYERKMNMKMKKPKSVKQHPKEIAPHFFHPPHTPLISRISSLNGDTLSFDTFSILVVTLALLAS